MEDKTKTTLKKEKIFLTPRKLAARWSMTPEALGQWRWNGKTPPYVKLGKKILYDLEEIENFEAQCIRHNTSQQGEGKATGFTSSHSQRTHKV